MTDEAIYLPVTRLPQVPRHVFGEPRHAKAMASGRPPQVERACPCGVVKITVFGSNGAAWREWRLPGSPDQYSDAMGTPPCSLDGGAST